MKRARTNSDMTLEMFGRMLMTASMMTLILCIFYRSFTTLIILNALRIVIAFDDAPPDDSSKCCSKNPISALSTMNMSSKFQLL